MIDLTITEALKKLKNTDFNNKTVVKFLQDYIDNLQSNINSLTNLLIIGDNKLNIVEIYKAIGRVSSS